MNYEKHAATGLAMVKALSSPSLVTSDVFQKGNGKGCLIFVTATAAGVPVSQFPSVYSKENGANLNAIRQGSYQNQQGLFALRTAIRKAGLSCNALQAGLNAFKKGGPTAVRALVSKWTASAIGSAGGSSGISYRSAAPAKPSYVSYRA